MSTVQSIVDDVRVEIDDTGSTRFSNDTAMILPLIKQAIRRANRICQRMSLHFAKKSAALTTVANQAYVNLPADFDIPIGLYRDDTHEKIAQRNEDIWERIESAAALDNWFLDLANSRVQFNGTPTEAIALTLWYYPTVDPSAYTVASTTPWSGRLDDIITRYVAMRLQNIDEMNIQVDQQIMADMEASIVNTYQHLSPQILEGEGWL